MAEIVQHRRGSTTDHEGFTGAPGELTVDTDKKTVVVHDGSTVGGFPLARASGEGSKFVQSETIQTIVVIWEQNYEALTAKDPYTFYIVIQPTLVAQEPIEFRLTIPDLTVSFP